MGGQVKKRTRRALILLAAAAVWLTGCEYDPGELSCNIFRNKVIADSQKFRQQQDYFSHVPFLVQSPETLADAEQASCMDLIEKFLQSTYRMSYAFPANTAAANDAWMDRELNELIASSRHFSQIRSDVQKNRMDLNIDELVLYNFCCDLGECGGYREKALFASVNLTVNGGDTDQFTALHPEYLGGDNLIDLTLIVADDHGLIKLRSWYESTRDPHQVTHYAPDGIRVMEKIKN